MGQILVRRVDDNLKTRLKQRAARHGVSMEEEVRAILQDIVLRDEPRVPGLGTRIAELFKDIPGNDEPLPHLPDEPVRPARFGE
ncbi:FitA-like ribbon-helix-helix domain-containing protein [Mesorhizobium yinganensis]|uniref:FitA-like ribbon-helix-helix domain-containing protein n=1 Tax=Mesorhizobium yinganensis TaxID=3157707 RepID=UPI0032B779D2